jgi:DIS3-like exonuclease 1
MVHRMLLRAIKHESSLIDNESLSELCSHLNRKHRASKSVQRQCTELFQSLYFRDRNPEISFPPPAEELDDAVIFNIRRNAFFVLVPKYGIKGPVYLRDKEGRSLIPPTALSYSRDSKDLMVLDFTVDERRQEVLLKTTDVRTPCIRLFDHITVRITVGTSRYHLPPIKLQLVYFGDPYADRNTKVVQMKDLIKEAASKNNMNKERLKLQQIFKTEV